MAYKGCFPKSAEKMRGVLRLPAGHAGLKQSTFAVEQPFTLATFPDQRFGCHYAT
jgi:hypothetical protein